jgi:hypothetical protein
MDTPISYINTLDINEKIQQKYLLIRQYKEKIKKLQKEIMDHKYDIWSSCEHEWIRTSNYDDLNNYTCKICGLPREKRFIN